LIASTGISVTDVDITLSNFTAATGGTNGSFDFTVSISKGSANADATKTGNSISATPVYNVLVAAMTNGSVSADKTTVEAGELITLTIVPDEGYELDVISAYKTGEQTTSVTLIGSGNTRTFTMPEYGVTVTATFKKSQEQLDKETLEVAKAAIEGGTYNIAQATGNTEEDVKVWLVNTLNVLFGQSHGIQFRSTMLSIVGDVTITTLTPAIAGTENNPEGINGLFKFTVDLTKGEAMLTTSEVPGIIIATPYIPVKCLPVENLQVTLSGTKNVELTWEAPNTPTVVSYSISRNASPIITLNSDILSYTDVNPGVGLHEYCVTAGYSAGSSEAVCGSIQVDKQQIKVEEENQTGVDGTGKLVLSLTIPTDVPFTGQFSLILPAGVELDLEATRLAGDLASTLQLSVEPQPDGSWLFTITPLAFRSATDLVYSQIVEIGYIVSETMEPGKYEAFIRDLSFSFEDDTNIVESEIPVQITVELQVDIPKLITTTGAYWSNGRLHVDSPEAEIIRVYSITGMPFHNFEKPAGAADYPVDKSTGAILIVKGSSGWVRKVICR